MALLTAIRRRPPLCGPSHLTDRPALRQPSTPSRLLETRFLVLLPHLAAPFSAEGATQTLEFWFASYQHLLASYSRVPLCT